MVIAIFLGFVLFVLVLSFYLGARTRTSSGYYAAGGQIHWGVNGIAFAGDYLSAASFLGICGMIAVVGYDGFLYSIGYLAGWIVALFVVAEPMKRLGKYTFTDAVDSKYDSRGIKLAAAISTLIVSVCYLIPQMVGAGVLVTPLLGLAHHWGVLMVGAIVITIVATAGMASTTYVQFLKGGMLIIFSTVLVIAVCVRGFNTRPDPGGEARFYEYKSMDAVMEGNQLAVTEPGWQVLEVQENHAAKATFARLSSNGAESWWLVDGAEGPVTLRETQSVVETSDGRKLINGAPASADNQLRQVGNVETLRGQATAPAGSVSPAGLLAGMSDPETTVRRWKDTKLTDASGSHVTVYYSTLTPGNRLMRPGLKFKVEGTPLEKFDFVSLMLALFLGTAALPHILIRYYTVPNPAAARKSTIVAIAGIGFFYILTLFMGLGATQQHGRAASGALVRPVPLCRDLSHRLRHGAGHRQRPDRRRFGSRGPRLLRSLPEPADVRPAEDPGRQDLGLRRRRHGHRPRHCLQGRQRDLPGRAGLCRGRFGQSPGDTDAALLEADDGARHHRLYLRWDRLLACADSAIAGPVQALRAGPDNRAGPVQQSGHRLDPVELHHPDCRVVADTQSHAGTRRSRGGSIGRGQVINSAQHSRPPDSTQAGGRLCSCMSIKPCL